MSIDIERLRSKCVPGYTLYGTDTVLPLLNEIESIRTKLDVLQRRTSRHSLAKDLGSAVDADAAIMARITAERDAALGEIEALRKAWTEAESDNNDLRAEIEKARAEPVRKVRLPPEITRLYGGIPDGAAMYYKDSVIDELKAAGIEVTQ